MRLLQLERLFELLSITCGAFGAVLAVGVLGRQILLWSKTGIWTPLPMSHVLEAWGVALPLTDWTGLQAILDRMLFLPGSLWFLASGLVLMGFFKWIADQLYFAGISRWKRRRGGGAANGRS